MSLTREILEERLAFLGGHHFVLAPVPFTRAELTAAYRMALAPLPPAGGETKAAPQDSEQSTKSEGEAALPSSTPAGAAPNAEPAGWVEEPKCLQVWRDDPRTFARTYQEVLSYIDTLRAHAALLQQEVERLKVEQRELFDLIQKDCDFAQAKARIISVTSTLNQADTVLEAAERRAEELREDAECFVFLQNLPKAEAQAFFWNFDSRRQRKKEIMATIDAVREKDER